MSDIDDYYFYTNKSTLPVLKRNYLSSIDCEGLIENIYFLNFGKRIK